MSAAGLEGMNILVTGANRGIGAALVEAAIARGAGRVYATARDIGSLGGLRARHGAKVVPLALDVTDPGAIDAAVAMANDVDLLVSNAGVTAPEDFMRCSDVDVRVLVEVNFLGPITLTRRFAETLARRRGGIIYVASIAALLPASRAPVYHGAKAGLMMMALSAREELAAMGIRTMLAYPGFVDTAMTARHDLPKASPADVASHMLDGWHAGEAAVFPDPYASFVRDQLAVSAAVGTAPDPAIARRALVAIGA